MVPEDGLGLVTKFRQVGCVDNIVHGTNLVFTIMARQTVKLLYTVTLCYVAKK